MNPLRMAAILLALSLTAIGACSYPIRNQALPATDHPEYTWKSLPSGGDTLVIVTASGGGTRAAALEMSVLQAMNQIRLPSGASLAERVDLLSSVSGGSVTAAYFALYGTEGFSTLENDFLRQDGIGTILWTGVNPVGLAELSTPSKERIDLLIDWLDRQLFKKPDFRGADQA
jgi:NTE family protein